MQYEDRGGMGFRNVWPRCLCTPAWPREGSGEATCFLLWRTGRSKRNGKASRYRNNTNPYEKNMKENWGPIVVRIQFRVIKGRTIWASRMSSVGNLLGLGSIKTFSEFITISNWPLLILNIKGTIIGNRRNTRAGQSYYPSYKYYLYYWWRREGWYIAEHLRE